MSSKHLRGDVNYAWPTAEVAVMGAKVHSCLISSQIPLGIGSLATERLGSLSGCSPDHLQRQGQPGRGRGRVHGEVRQPLPGCCQRWFFACLQLTELLQSPSPYVCVFFWTQCFRFRGWHHWAVKHSAKALQRSGGAGQQEAGQPLEEACQHSTVMRCCYHVNQRQPLWDDFNVGELHL